MLIYLSVGDGATSDAIAMNDLTTITTTGLTFDPYDDAARERLCVHDVLVKGASADAIMTTITSIETKLNQARQAASLAGGTWVTLGMKPTGATYYTYADILRGALQFDRTTMAHGYAAVQITYVCLPALRGDVVTTTVTGTVTNTDGTPATPGNTGSGGLFIADVVGELPAPCLVTLVDTSSSGVINRVRAGVYARASMLSTDMDAWLDQTTVSPGTSGTSNTNRIGSNYGSVTVSDTWQTLASFTGGTATAINRGEHDVWVRASNTVDIAPPTNLAMTGQTVGGLEQNTVFTIRVTSISSGGFETAASEAIYARTGDNTHDALKFSWTTHGSDIASHHIYYTGGTQTNWKYHTTGNANSSGTLSTYTGGTIGDPPTAMPLELSQPYIRAQVGLSSLTNTYNRLATQMNNGTAWTNYYIGRYTLPPWSLGEGQTDQRWAMNIQAITSVFGGTAGVRVDAAVLMPPWPQIVCEYPGMALATKREWVFGTNRAGRSGCIIQTTDTHAEIGQAGFVGELYVLPGDNLLNIMVDQANGVSDVISATYTITVSYWPRYRGMRGN